MTGPLDPAGPRPATGRGTGSLSGTTTTTQRATQKASQGAEATSGRALPKTHLAALFAVYLVLLVWVVMWKLEVPWVGEAGWRIVKLVPFGPSVGAGASTPFDVVVNLALFVPFGVYLGLLAPSWRWWKAVGTLAAASLSLEVAQYVLAVGSSDLTDIVVNVAGGLAGTRLLALARRRLGARTATVMTRVCSIGTVIAVLASASVVASPLRYAPPQDVRCVSTQPAPCTPPGDGGDGAGVGSMQHDGGPARSTLEPTAMSR